MVSQVEPELRRVGAALFHGLANFDLPIRKPRGTRFVLTVHDLIPLEWPEAVSRAYRLQFRAWLMRCLDLADAIVCPTQAVAAGLRETFPRAPPARVISMGVTRRSPRSEVAVARRYFLALGSVEIRKNLSLLRRAFESNADLFSREGIELWIAGQPGYGGAAIVAELQNAGAGVKFLGPQSARALADLMRGALALCAPSLAEGFGLPPLEALALGTPVLASDIPAHREVLGEAAELLPPTEVEAWGAALRRVAADPDFRGRLARLGPVRAAEHTWARTARQTEALYREVLGESSGEKAKKSG